MSDETCVAFACTLATERTIIRRADGSVRYQMCSACFGSRFCETCLVYFPSVAGRKDHQCPWCTSQASRDGRITSVPTKSCSALYEPRLQEIAGRFQMLIASKRGRKIRAMNPPRAEADPICDNCISERIAAGDLVQIEGQFPW
jgi:hypothetical protein